MLLPTTMGHPLTLCGCVLILALVVSNTEACPSVCACSVHQVDCYGRNLRTIPADIPDTIVYVDLQENLIQVIDPDRLSRLQNLENLVLRRNKLTRIEAGTFANITTLKRLHLGGNEIDFIDPNAFSNLPSLQVLDLSVNLITNITGMFVNIPSIERLVLGMNQITELDRSSFMGVDKLRYLILSRNQISYIAKDTFDDLNLLSYLILRGNPLRRVDKLWDGLHVLTFLDLSDCQLYTFPQGLPWTLNILRLGNNSINEITIYDLRSQRYLGVLCIENNLISNIQYGSFSYSSHLHQVDVSGNRLQQLPHDIPAYIESFNADNNNIRHLFTGNFDHDSKMVELSLKNNSIGNLAANTFGRLMSLTSLDLGRNDIKVLYNMTFSGLRKLETLGLDSNPIGEIEYRAFGGLSKLSKLTMSQFTSNATEIKGNVFQDIPSLSTLDIHESPSLARSLMNRTELLWPISSLKYLNIMGNNLEYMSTDILVTLPLLRLLMATANPWRCNADLIPLRKWMEKFTRTFGDVYEMKCASPPTLRGKSILRISLSEFMDPTTLLTTTATTTETSTENVTVTNTPTALAGFSEQLTTSPSIAPTTDQSHQSNPTVTDFVSNTTPVTPPDFNTPTGSVTAGTSSHPPGLESTTDSSSTNIAGYTSTTHKYNGSSDASDTFTHATSSSPASKITVSTTSKQDKIADITSTDSSMDTIRNHTVIKSTPSALTTTMGTTEKLDLTTTANPNGQSTFSNRTIPSTTSKTSNITDSPPAEQSSQTVSNSDYSTFTSPTFSPLVHTSTRGMANSTTKQRTVQSTDGDINHQNTDQNTGTGRHAPSIASSSSSSGTHPKTGLFVGVAVGALCLILSVVVIVVMVRYNRRKKKSYFVDHDVTFAPHHQETADTVCIINHLHESTNDDNNGKSADIQKVSGDVILSTNPAKQPGNSSEAGSKPDKKTRKISNGTTRPSISCMSKGDDDDTDMLMDSWS